MSQRNQTCPVCGTDNEPEALFCAECGTRLQPTPEQNPPAEASDATAAASPWRPPATQTTPESSLASDVPPAMPTPTPPESAPAPATPTPPVGPIPPAAPSTPGATGRAGAPAAEPPVPVGPGIGEPSDGN